jgi:hypothetical protein
MLEPEIQEGPFYGALRRLVNRDLIVKRFEGIFRNAGVFYQLNQIPLMREKIADLLRCPANAIHQPQFQMRELLHAESCALWAHYLRKIYPDAIVVRDYEFIRSEAAKDAMIYLPESGENSFQISPDIMLIFKSEEAKRTTVIAFEIERTRKSIERLTSKLRKYAYAAQVDGLVYVCATDRLAQLVERIYQDRVLEKAHRIRHYAKSFLMFATEDLSPLQASQNLFNSHLKPSSLTEWIAYLVGTPTNDRKEKQFQS